MSVDSLIIHKTNLPANNVVASKRSQSLIKKIFRILKDKLYIKTPKQSFELSTSNYYHYFTADNSQNYKYMTFTFSYIALAAKLILLDGDANEEEIEALIESFPVTPNHISKITSLFYSAYIDETSDEKFAIKIKELFADNHKLLQQLLNSLVKIATSDLLLTTIEMDWLIKIGNILGFTGSKVCDLAKYHLMPKNFDPYALLNNGESLLTPEQLSKNYRNLAFIYHPDNLIKHDNIAKEYIEVSSNKFNAITQAYEELKEISRNGGPGWS